MNDELEFELAMFDSPDGAVVDDDWQEVRARPVAAHPAGKGD